MRLAQLESFLAIVEAGSFTAAADQLHLSQPALSRQISELERELGTPLFVRGRHGAAVTNAGEALHEQAQQILSLVADTPGLVRRSRRRRVSARIGLAPGLPDTWLRECVAGARAALPPFGLVVVEATTEIQAQRLVDGELDLGFMHRPPLGLDHDLVLEQPLGLATPDPGPAPESPAVPMRSLDGLPVLSHGPDDTSLHHDQLLFAARQAGAQPRWIFREFTQYVDLAVEWAGAVGAVVVEASAERLVPGWCWRPIAAPEIKVATYLVRRDGLTGVAAAFADALVSGATS